MKGNRTKRYIGLALSILLAVNSVAAPFGMTSVLAADELQAELGGGITEVVSDEASEDGSGIQQPVFEESAQLKEGAEQPVIDGAADAPVLDSEEGTKEEDVASDEEAEENLVAQDLGEEIAPLAETHVVYEDGSKHKPSRQTVIFEDTFENGNNWTLNDDASTGGMITFSNGEVITKADGTNANTQKILRRMVCSSAGITADKIKENQFLIQLDITPAFASTNAGAQLRIAFQTNSTAIGDYFQVRLHGKDTDNKAKLLLDQVQNGTTETTKTWSELTWIANQKLAMDILVNTSDNSVKVFVDGTEKVSYTGATLGTGSELAIIRSWGGANIVSIDNLKVTTGDEVVPPPPATHTTEYSSYTCELIKDDFTNGNNWDVITPALGAGVVSFADGKVILKTSSNNNEPNNRIGYNKGKILADKFLIKMDVTPKMNLGENGDLRIGFKAAANYEDKRMQVRLNASNRCVTVDTVTGANTRGQIGTKSKDLVWTPGNPFGLDIAVDTTAKTVKVYINGEEYLVVNCNENMISDKGYFSIAGQAGQHNFEIDNLVVTTDERIAPMSRVLVDDNFDTGDNWKTNNDTVIKIENGKATFSGSGAENRMGYKNKIGAKDMLVQFDLTTGDDISNSSAFAAFRYATDAFTGDRLHVRFDLTGKMIYLERTQNVSTHPYDVSNYQEKAAYTFEANKTYAVDILVKGNNLKVYINKTMVLDKTDNKIGELNKGYFAFIGKYPKQYFSIDNLKISTDENPGTEYTVTLESAANGTVTADRTTGYEGDIVTLTANPAAGYLFEKFTLRKANGTPVDTTNNTFALDGNVTVTAHFTKREQGPYELFFDDFAAASLNEKYKVKAANSGVKQENGVLTISGTDNSDFLLLSRDIFKDLREGDGYRISVDMWKQNATNGTVHVMFRGSSDTDITKRHVIALNGSEAVALSFTSDRQVLKTVQNIAFNQTKSAVVLEVQDNTYTCRINGTVVFTETVADWKEQLPMVGLINMTAGAPVAFDNLKVERIPAKVALSTKVMLRNGGTMTEDKTANVGMLSLSSSSAIEGDVITLNPVAKVGYRLVECYVEGSQDKITNNSYTIPAGWWGSKYFVAVFEPATQGGARDYYIDSANGNDANPGSQAAPWKSFAPLKNPALILAPGSNIFLKRGSVFTKQQFTFNGMGTKGKPITVNSYGKGNLPILAGGGEVENVVYLYNQEYITIRNLEITNTSSSYNSSFGLNKSDNKELPLRAIRVVAKDFGIVSGIHIQDCYIHDINGNLLAKWNGGIFFDVEADVVGGAKQSFTLPNNAKKEWLVGAEITGVRTKYDDVLIEGCTFINVDRSAIKLVNSRWCNQWEANNLDTPVDWYPSTNVIVRNNYLEKIGGDGITVRDTDGALIEHNLARDCRYQVGNPKNHYNVAIWPFQAANTVIQYNEAYGTRSVQDGQGFDCDHAASYSVMQYNYSHDNEGGFMLIMGGYPHTAATVRYNMSQNDKDKAFEFSQGIPKGVMIYNNTIYSKDKLAKGIFHLGGVEANCQVTEKVNDFYAFNNIFCYPLDQTIYSGGEGSQIPAKAHLYNNAYVGGIQPPTEEKNKDAATVTELTIADAASVFESVGTAPETNDTRKPRTGDSGLLNGYKLKAGSALIDKGVTMAEAITAFGGSISSVVDGRKMSPRDLYNSANAATGKNSLNYVMANNFPEVAGVNYNLDFFGNKNIEGAKHDIGAAESLNHTHTGGTAATCAEKSVCDTCKLPYGALNPKNHTGETEIRNAAEATTAAEGYTGDTYCKGCGEKLKDGTAIAKLPGGSPSGSSSGGGSSNEQQPAAPTVKEPEKPAETPAEQPKPVENNKKLAENNDNKPVTVPATVDKMTVAADASEKLPDNMELKVAEIKEEQKVVLENQVTAGEHKEVFAGLKMEFVEIQLILTENGNESEVHDKQVTFMISLPKGVTKENHKDYHFFALHLKADGSTELLKPESTEKGLRVTSTLSSFALGYGLHEEGEGVTVKEPTETAQGEMAYSCIGCGALIRTIAIPALGKKGSAGASGDLGIETPKADEGNRSMLFIILCLAVLAACGAGVLILSRKHRG